MKINLNKLKKDIRIVGNAVMKLYNQDFSIDHKQDSSPVTEADLLSNKLLVKILEKTNIPILSEEIKDNPERLNSNKLWIIDPLDGTKDFIQKTDEFSIMVGLVENGKPVLDIVYAPALDKIYYAEKGQGAFVESNGKTKKLKVSTHSNYQDWTILVSRNHLGKEEVTLSEKLNFKKKKPTGSIGVKLGIIAEGSAEMYLHAIDKTWEWDVAAAEIILNEAGGTVTDIDGEKMKFNKEVPKNFRGILATNGFRHEEIVQELKQM